MMTGAGRVVFMDFGTGCDPLDGSSATLAGTPLYLAPELLRGSAPTVQSDIYSLGVLLYHLLTGSYPVQAENLGLLRAAHELREGFGAEMLVQGLPRRLGRSSIARSGHTRASATATSRVSRQISSR